MALHHGNGRIKIDLLAESGQAGVTWGHCLSHPTIEFYEWHGPVFLDGELDRGIGAIWGEVMM